MRESAVSLVLLRSRWRRKRSMKLSVILTLSLQEYGLVFNIDNAGKEIDKVWLHQHR